MAINTPEKTIVTIEDPVEYRLTGVKQVQVNEKHGVTFASGLRSMMRADPDTIMVGEIRDSESAKIATEAAITGHLVLSTLHTNDAPTAMTRLIEMGIEPYLVASAVNRVIAQRLARQLCDSCRKPATIPSAALESNGNGSVDIYEPVGCQRCGGTGYRGRIDLFEVMPVSDGIRRSFERAPADQIGGVAIKEGMRTPRQDGTRWPPATLAGRGHARHRAVARANDLIKGCARKGVAGMTEPFLGAMGPTTVQSPGRAGWTAHAPLMRSFFGTRGRG